jgi:hypothetical protein
MHSLSITTNVVSSIPLRRGVLDTTLCDTVCQWLAAGRWFSPSPPVSSTNKTDRHDIIEISLKVELNTITLTYQFKRKYCTIRKYITNLQYTFQVIVFTWKQVIIGYHCFGTYFLLLLAKLGDYTGLTWHPLFNQSLKIPMNVYVFFFSGRQFYSRTSHTCLKIRSSKISFTPPLTFLVFFYLLICVAVKTLILYGLYLDLMICRMFYLYIGLCGYANSFVSYLI